MVELVHNDIVVEVRGSFCGKVLGIESLDGDKQIIDTFRLVAAYKHLTKVCILQYSAESVHILLQDFLTMSYKQQSTRLIRILLPETLIVQCRNNCFTSTGSCHNQVAIVATNLSLSFQLIQNFLLIRIRRDIHGIDFGIIGAEVFFCIQRTSQTFLLILGVVFELVGIPVAFKGCSNLSNGFGKVLLGDLYVPL